MLGTNSFLLAAIAAIFLGLLDNPAVPMAIVIVVCATASTVLNYLTLGERLEIAPQVV